MTNLGNSFVLATVAAMIAGAATAQDQVTLRFGTHQAATSPGVVEGIQILIDKAEELSGGTLKIDLFPGEQAGKALQMYDLVKAGAVDMGMSSSGYVSSDKLPMIGMLELPGLAKSTCDVANAITTLGEEGGILYESEMKPSGMRVLAYMPYPPYGPAVSRNEISQVSDLSGMKMRIAGGLMEHTAVAVGGVPVKIPAPEVFQALQRGTLDTVMFAFLSVKTYDLASVVDYGTTGYSFGTPGDLLLISQARLASLTVEQQTALLQAGREASQHWCAFADAEEAKDIAEMEAAGLKVHTWTDEQVAELNALTASVAEEWATQLDARGKPASALVAQFKELMAQ